MVEKGPNNLGNALSPPIWAMPREPENRQLLTDEKLSLAKLQHFEASTRELGERRRQVKCQIPPHVSQYQQL